MPLPWPFHRDPLLGLLERARAGDEQAFTALYDALYPRVWTFVTRRTRTRDEAEEVVSRAFHKLVERLAEVEARQGGALPFVLACARNLLIDDARARRANLSLEDAGAALLSEARSPLGELLREEELRRLREELDRLPAEARELLALRYGDGLEHGEIAALLGLSVAAVRQRASRTLRTLRQALRVSAPEKEVAHEP